MGNINARDPLYVTEVYPLPDSDPDGKVVIRKGRDIVIIWPGDLPKLINQLVAERTKVEA